MQKTIYTARDIHEIDGIASSFAIKGLEMDQSVRSVAENFCLVHTLTKK